MGMNYQKKISKNIIRELLKGDTKDRITAFYLDSDFVRLSEKEEQIRIRWSKAFTLLNQFHSVQQVVQVLMREHNISEAQAYRDIKSSTELFGDVAYTSKEAYRSILFEYAMKIYQLAASKHDLGEMNKALAIMVKIKGLDKESDIGIDFEKLQPHTFNINFPVEELKVLNTQINGGFISLLSHGDESN